MRDITRSSSTAGFASLGLVLLGCGPESHLAPFPNPPPGYEYAYATRDCAPWDGPAVTLYFAGSPSDSIPMGVPHLRVSIWKSPAELANRTVRWPADLQGGAALRCAAADSCEPANGGQISFGGTRPDSSVEGVLLLRWVGGDSVRGSFRAAWRSRRIMCG